MRSWRPSGGPIYALLVAGCTAITGLDDLAVTSPTRAGDRERDGTSGGTRGGDGPLTPEDGGQATADRDGDAAPNQGKNGIPIPCPGFAILCDGFESGDTTKWTSLFQPNGGTVSVIPAPARGGTWAMRALAPQAPPVDGGYPKIGAGVRVQIAPVASGMIALRAYVQMAAPLAKDTTFFKVVSANGEDDMNVKIHTTGQIKVDTDVPSAGPELLASRSPPIGTWFCVEWQATIGAVGGQKLILDGETILDATENNLSAPGYDLVHIGFIASDGERTQEILFDDVVVATQPIGCQ